MRSFFQHLKAAWRYGVTYPYLPWADEPDRWNVLHAANLSRFMETETGQLLKARMANLVSRRAVAVTKDPDSTLRDNGTVDGIAGTIAFIEGHMIENMPELEAEPPEQAEVLEELEEVFD